MGICQSRDKSATTDGAVAAVHAVKATFTTKAATASSKSASMRNHNTNNNTKQQTPYQKPTPHGKHVKGGGKSRVSSPSRVHDNHHSTPNTVNAMDADEEEESSIDGSMEPVTEESIDDEDEDSKCEDYDDNGAIHAINDAVKGGSSYSSNQKKKNSNSNSNSLWFKSPTAITDIMEEDEGGGVSSPPCPMLLFHNNNNGNSNNAGTITHTSPNRNTLSVVSESQSQKDQQQLQQQQQPLQLQQQQLPKRRHSSKKKKRNSGRSTPPSLTTINSDGFGSSSSSTFHKSSKLMTPLQLAPLEHSMIPEEEDPTAPSDEEDFNEELDSQEPGRLVPNWKSAGITPTTLMSPLTVSWSYDDDDKSNGKTNNKNTSPSSLAATNLATARSSMSPEAYAAALEQSRSAVKPKQYSNFQKLKLQVALAERHEKKQASAHKRMDRAADVQSYRQLYHTFQNMQQELQQQQQASVDAAALSEAAEYAAEAEAAKDTLDNDQNEETPGPVVPMKRVNSFNLKNTNTWYFDFQAPDLQLQQPNSEDTTVNVTAASTVAAIAADTDYRHSVDFSGTDDDDDDISIVSRQSGLSLLSEATMDAQRRLYAEKRRARRRRKAGNLSPSAKSIGASARLSATTGTQPSTTPRRDYGPVRRLQKMTQPQKDTIPVTDMDISFVHSPEDAASSPSRQHQQHADDASMVSDMGDDHSYCSIASNNTNSNNDYRVPRRVRRSYNPDDATTERNPVKMSFSFDEGAMAAVSVLRSNASNSGSPNRNRNRGAMGVGGVAATDQALPSSIQVLGVAGVAGALASPLPHSQLMNRFDQAETPSRAIDMVSSSAVDETRTVDTAIPATAATMMAAPTTTTLDSKDRYRNEIRNDVSASPSMAMLTGMPMKDAAELDFLPRMEADVTTTKNMVATTTTASMTSMDRDQNPTQNYISEPPPIPGTSMVMTDTGTLDFLPRLQTDATTTATADGQMDAPRPTIAPVTPDNNSALPSITKPNTATLADTGNASRDPLLEKEHGSNVTPSTPAGATDFPTVISPDCESPIMANIKNMASPESPDSSSEDSFWGINSTPVIPALLLSPDDSVLTEEFDVNIKGSPDEVKLVSANESDVASVDPAITAMSTEEFLRMSEDSSRRYDYKREFSSSYEDSDTGASLLLAQEVEAQVKNVLSKYREYGDVHVADAKAESHSGADVSEDEPPRIISP